MYLHTRRHRKKQLQNGVSDVFCPVVEMCLFLVRVGWDFLENLGFGGFSKENQGFPKFPKVSQSFPKFPKRSRVTFSCEFGLVGIFWKTLVLVAFPRKTKVSQSFPKFPKVSQSFPNVPASPFRSSLCFVSTPVGDCSEAPEGGFPKETQSSQKKSQASSPVLLARVRSHSPLS